MNIILEIINLFHNLKDEEKLLKDNLSVLLERILNTDHKMTYQLISNDIIITKQGQFYGYDYSRLYEYAIESKPIIH